MEKKINQKTVCIDHFYSKNKNVQIRDETNETFLLFNMNNFESLIINETGKYIWETCDGMKSINEIISGIKNNFDLLDGQQESIEKIVVEFIELLLMKDLIYMSVGND